MKYGIKEEYWKKLCELFAKKPKAADLYFHSSNHVMSKDDRYDGQSVRSVLE